ncbi:MAG: transporter [Planctomycetes bacterium GWF2_41_51]|nr:MAG: transporter [Planctomycetes bacterium GWF2_41_51]
MVCFFMSGCSPAKYREDIDKTADKILAEKQYDATGKRTKFSINRPSDILRKRLLKGQNLPVSSPASLGAEKLQEIEHWPEKGYPHETTGGKITDINDVNGIVVISLLDALQIGAYNSFDYQTRKEEIFQTALELELERDEFRNSFFAQIQNLVSTDTTGNRTVSGTVTSGSVGVSRRFMNGAEVTSSIGIDFANLLTNGREFSRGLSADMTISIPLLRGSGRHIVTEPLIQAERNVIYAFWDFEQFKKDFAVGVATRYLTVLQQLDEIKNTASDYRSRIDTANRSRRLADAGRIQEIEVDQAVQQELSARQSWIRATQSYKRELDSFKVFLGLPPDADLELDPNELEKLIGPAMEMINEAQERALIDESPIITEDNEEQALVEIMEPDYKNAGPYEIKEPNAIQLAFFNRLDLKRTEGQVYDAQRAVVVAADALRAELTFLGEGRIGSGRSIGSTGLPNATFVANEGVFSSLVTLDLPFERTLEAVNYRNSYIALERSVRDVQTLEDSIKIDIRNSLRDSLEARENMYIQAKAVAVAQKRVKSVNMFLDAGRAQIRDLLEAQDALLEAQNALTAAIVRYRISELNIQRDMGVLEIDENGLWKEYFSGEQLNVKEENLYY